MQIGMSSTRLLADRVVHGWPTGRGPGCSGARRGQRGDLGRTAQLMTSPGAADAARGRERVARTGHGGHHADSVDSGVLSFSTGSVIGAGGYIDTANQRLQIRNVLPVVHPRGPGQGDAGRPRGQGSRCRSAPSARSPRTNQPLIGDAIINGQPGLLLVVEKLPWGNTLQITKGVEDARRRSCSRGCRTSLRHHHLPARRTSSTESIAQPHPGAAARLPAGPGDPGAFLFEWRVAADQPADHPAVADRRRCWCCTGPAPRSTR